MKRGRDIKSFFITKTTQNVTSTTSNTETPSSQNTEHSVDEMPGPGPAETEEAESERQPGPDTEIKKTQIYSFRQDWLKEFPWLRYDKERNAMHCVYCPECGQSMALLLYISMVSAETDSVR